MEAVIFIGIQATGKSTFYKQRFADSHLRINLDMLKTRHREAAFLRTCLETGQRFVVDNTNPTVADRTRYIGAARDAKFRVIGFFFQSSIGAALERNAERSGRAHIPTGGIIATHCKLELPVLAEGFDELHFVRITGDGGFSVEEWCDEVR